jgi:hypothetical protein
MSTSPKATPISSYVTDDLLVELVYNPFKQETKLAVFDHGQVAYHDSLTIDGVALKPVHPRNDLLCNNVVLFPSTAVEYDNEKKLLEEIQQFIHRYLDVTPFFEKLAAYYVLLSWATTCSTRSRICGRSETMGPARRGSCK